MNKKNTLLLAALVLAIAVNEAGSQGNYRISKMSYQGLHDKADLVVIAKPNRSMIAKERMRYPFDENHEDYLKKIDTVITTFDVLLIIKGNAEIETIDMLHFNKKDKNHDHSSFLADGCFFIDFDKEHERRRSYLLFLEEYDLDEKYHVPAHNPWEGSRAIFPLPSEHRMWDPTLQ